MAKLSKGARASLPSSKFAGPGRTFPVENKAHAEAALMDVGKSSLSPKQKQNVLAAARAELERSDKV